MIFSAAFEVILGRQQPFNLSHHAIHFFLIRQGDHEKFVALVETDDAVGEEPDAIKHWIAAENPTYRRAGNTDRVYYLCEHHSAHRATEGAQERCADVLGHLFLKLDALTLGFV